MAILMLLLALALMPVILGLVGLFGYFFGVLLVKTPLLGELLTGSLISEANVPTLMAWIFIAAVVFSTYAPRVGGDSK